MGLVSTSYTERQNLNVRMKNRRFTRLTNAFSKKAENLAYSIALGFMHHNFVRKHMTINTTPARAAGIANRTWTIRDIVEATGLAKTTVIRLVSTLELSGLLWATTSGYMAGPGLWRWAQ